MSSSSSSKIKVRFLIDKEQERVVFAEAGSEFVDVLFSFFTLPLGRISHLLDSCLGSVDTIWESVQKFDVKHLQTKACKEMLFNPRSAFSLQCEDLKINIMLDRCPRIAYTCRKVGCLIQTKCYYTFTSKESLCSRCGKQMDRILKLPKKTSKGGGVFVNDALNFIITDDLHVMPNSLSNAFSLLEELKINDARTLEERVIDLDKDDVLTLLERSLDSNNPLTDVCFSDYCNAEMRNLYLPSIEKIDTEEAENKIGLKLFLNKKSDIVLFAEVGEDLVNLLFSFLTFPLGSFFGLFSGGMSSFGGCIKNLYLSIENMDSNCFKSEICRDMLLIPKLSAFYGIKNSILELEEIKPTKSTVLMSCVKCYLDNWCKTCALAPCAHGLGMAELVEQNPKSENGETNHGGAFVVGSKRFILSNSFEITPLTSISTILGMYSSMSDIVEVEVFVDRVEARSLLSALMISTTSLTDVFSAQLKRRSKSI